jgi:hypothetical protein
MSPDYFTIEMKWSLKSKYISIDATLPDSRAKSGPPGHRPAADTGSVAAAGDGASLFIAAETDAFPFRWLMSLYYHPSNKMPLGGVLLLVLGGAVAAAGLAFVYVYAIWYIPFIYANFTLCIGFGIVLGFVLMLLSRAGKLRSPDGVGKLALLVGLVAVYLEWTVYLTLLFNSETTGTGTHADTSTAFSAGTFVNLLTHPGIMAAAIADLNQTGSWTLKGARPAGIFLALVWLLEIAFVLGGTYIMARLQAGDPFSEATNQWADEETLPHPLSYAPDEDALRTALEDGQYHVLTPHLADTGLGQFAHLKLYSAPNDTTCYYLTLENITKSLDDKGKPTQQTEPIVQYLAIAPATYQELKTRFGTWSAPGSAV